MRRRAFIVVGLGFGDEGKGSVVDWLTREMGADLVVRYNGGAQAAHNVIVSSPQSVHDGKHHCFRMFGSGTLVGARTYLSEYCYVDPLVLANEASELVSLGVLDPFGRMVIHRDAPVTTPFHAALNRFRELVRGDGRHGSCGYGIGETTRDVLAGRALRWGDVVGLGRESLATRLRDVQRRLADEATDLWPDDNHDSHWGDEYGRLFDRDLADVVAETYNLVAHCVYTTDRLPRDAQTIVFEGAQGVLLDQRYGFSPYTTWTDTTPANARSIIRAAAGTFATSTLGVVRSFATRHGAGPLPTEFYLTYPAHLSNSFRDPIVRGEHNDVNDWQGKFRYGWPDAVSLRYASAIARPHGLVVTCQDRLEGASVGTNVALAYRRGTLAYVPRTEAEHRRRTDKLFTAQPVYETVRAEVVPDRLAELVDVPLWAVSRGPTAAEKEWVIKTTERKAA